VAFPHLLTFTYGGSDVDFFPTPGYCSSFNNCFGSVWDSGVPSGGSGIFIFSSVPEPSTWAMLLIGFAGIGYAGFRRRLVATG
jgi:hypothetical protein